MQITKNIAAGNSTKLDKDGNPKTWAGGEIKLVMPEVKDLSAQQLENLLFNSLKDHAQYGASTLWRNHKGVCPEKGVTAGRFLWDKTTNVISFNPDYRVGSPREKSPEQIAKLEALAAEDLKAFALRKKRPATDTEIELIREKYGLINPESDEEGEAEESAE